MLCYPQISFKIPFPPHAGWQSPPNSKELRQPYAKVPKLSAPDDSFTASQSLLLSLIHI